MALERADRVGEVTTSTGTGTLNLGGGAVSGFQTFAGAGISNGATVEYLLIEGTDWEVGQGTFTDAATDTLSRDTVLDSSNAGSLVNFTSAPTAYITLPANRLTLITGTQDYLGIGSEALTDVPAPSSSVNASIVLGMCSGATVDSVSIGHNNGLGADATGKNTIIGRGSSTSGRYGVALGYNCDIGAANNAMLMGNNPTPTGLASGDVVIGDSVVGFGQVYIGKGASSGSPIAVTMQPQKSMGTDIAGTNLTLAGGRGTGSGAGGHLIFQTAAAGGSGSSLNSLATMLELTDDDKIGFFGVTPVVQPSGYTTFTNLSTDRTCDANATSVAELADILGTLIEDLKGLGLISA